MAAGLTGSGPDFQNQKHIVCRQVLERGSCSFGDRCEFSHDSSIFTGKPNSNSRNATPKIIPKGTPRGTQRGTPRGTPRGGTPKKDSKEKRHKSPKPSAVAEVVEIDAGSSAESSSSSEEDEFDSESDGSLSTSREQKSPSSSEWKLRGPSDNLIHVRSATHEFNTMNATILKTTCGPVLDEIKGRIIIDTGPGSHCRTIECAQKEALNDQDWWATPEAKYSKRTNWFHKLCQHRFK